MAQSLTHPSDCDDLAAVVRFLDTIGLPWQWRSGARGFVEHVRIEDGGLLIDPAAHASAVLHEAGHLSILPAEFRPLAQANVDAVNEIMCAQIDWSDPDSPVCCAAVQCSDPEATAWAWAAGLHLGLSPARIIRDEEYGGDGAEVRLQLLTGRYAGIHGLVHAGLCAAASERFARAQRDMGLGVDVRAYPVMTRWLQQDFGTTAQADRARTRMVWG